MSKVNKDDNLKHQSKKYIKYLDKNKDGIISK